MMNKYDKLFLKQARMGYTNFSHRYHRNRQDNDLIERKHLQNREFVFSDENVNRLSAINAKSGDIDHLNPVERDHLLSGVY